MNRRSRRTPKHQELRTMLTLRTAVTVTLLAVFCVNVLSVLCVIFLAGFGKMELSDKLILTLIAETIAVAGTGLIAVARSVFDKNYAV